ncbi:MAG: CehA/McbA family metallohydrolase [Carbonactinosporaceae bacterium]
MVVHRGRWTPEDRRLAVYRYLPVDVPPGSASLRVRLTYDHTAGVLDLGCFGASGFRGWSGGARGVFVIGTHEATPGYLAGELEAGTWFVALGLHRVADRGVAYEVSAEASRRRVHGVPSPPPPPPLGEGPPRRELPAAPGRRWLAGDLHTHSVHSDGVLGPGGLARLGVERGLDFLAVTDHNTTSHHAALPAAGTREGITLVAGQELTTDAGHANAFGDIGWVDFREPADTWADRTARRGGLLSINHPLAGAVAWRHAMTRPVPLVEVWHWSWGDRRWSGPLDWWRTREPAATPVGGSDWHRPGSDALPGAPTTWVECDDVGAGAVLAALRAGRVAISASRDGPILVRHDGGLLALGAAGAWLVKAEGGRRPVHRNVAWFPCGPGCHRLVDATDATLALTG